jgi:hypothetical protein
MFATDRDLLIIEPTLVRDVSFLAQEPVRGTGNLSGTTLTLAGASFTGAGVGPGHVALVGRTPLEILAVTGASTATVSLLRESTAAPAIGPQAASGAPVAVVTFRPQIALAHAQLLRLFGLRPAGSALLEGEADESAVVNAAELAHFEALGALHLIYAAAAALAGDATPIAQRASMYRDRFARERWRARARLDLDADGVPDAERTANLSRLARA